MVITESELRELWRDGRYPLPAFPPGTRFSPAAQDFIKDHRLVIRFTDPPPAAIERLAAGTSDPRLATELDALHALTMLVAAEARRYQLPALAHRLDTLAEYCLGLRAAEQQGRDPAPMPSLAPGSGGPDFAPGPTDHAILHWLNFLRASAHQAAAQASSAGSVKMAVALAQVGDTAAGLGRQVQSGELGWNAMGDTANR